LYLPGDSRLDRTATCALLRIAPYFSVKQEGPFLAFRYGGFVFLVPASHIGRQ
jgi:hypothetical protein